MMATTFWGPDGKPLSAAQFLESLFGALPALFKDEQELRRLWSNPETRKRLLDGLAERGFGHDHLAEMQRLISAEKSDLYDVLAFVAFASPPVERTVRADQARREVRGTLSMQQRSFIEFVLAQYVRHGVEELGLDKLTPLLRLKYSNSVADATNDLGSPEDIRRVFIEFQGGLYRPVRVA